MNNNNLAPGFISVDDACALIKQDDRDNPIIDLDWMMDRIDWIDVNHNFRIPKIRKLAPEEIYKDRRGRYVYFENTGSVYVGIRDSFDKELLKKTIRDRWRDLVGHEYSKAKLRGITTVADDGEGKSAVQPRTHAPMAKAGDTIGTGQTVTSNGENYA